MFHFQNQGISNWQTKSIKFKQYSTKLATTMQQINLFITTKLGLSIICIKFYKLQVP